MVKRTYFVYFSSFSSTSIISCRSVPSSVYTGAVVQLITRQPLWACLFNTWLSFCALNCPWKTVSCWLMTLYSLPLFLGMSESVSCPPGFLSALLLRFKLMPPTSVLFMAGFCVLYPAIRRADAGLLRAGCCVAMLRACATVSVCCVRALASMCSSVMPGVAKMLLNG